MNSRLIAVFRRVSQRVRHWPPLRFLEPIWSLLRRPYLWILNSAGSAHGIKVTVGGHPLRLHPAFATLRWEYLEHAAYSAFVDELRPDSVVFDVGAHIGTYSLLAAGRVQSPGQVIAYEPHARTREYLRQHLLWNSGGEQVQVAEWDVLKGASGILSRNQPVLLLSLHPQALKQQGWSPEAVLDWLRERGYDCRTIGQDYELHVLAKPALASSPDA